MKVLQINATVNSGSTGRIAEEIGLKLLGNGDQSLIAYGREGRKSTSHTIRIGSQSGVLRHVLVTKLFDRHGFGSKSDTKKFIHSLEQVDLVHLHNIHGYYLHVGELFDWLKETQKPVIWTLHDCWPFTGHCTFFDSVGCEKWITICHHCPKTRLYPASWGIDNSIQNYKDKKSLFNGLEKMTIVTPSQWLQAHVKNSFLKDYSVKVIPNGIDLNIFTPQTSRELRLKLGIGDKKVVLGVANTWDKRKGLDDFVKLYQSLDESWQIILIGVSPKQMNILPSGILGVARTESMQELAAYYSLAEVFVNPTWQDNFPTTNLEALACGTPVITYATGGSTEAIDESTGIVVEKGNIEGIVNAIKELESLHQEQLRINCRERAEKLFDKNDRYQDYLNLYKDILNE